MNWSTLVALSAKFIQLFPYRVMVKIHLKVLYLHRYPDHQRFVVSHASTLPKNFLKIRRKLCSYPADKHTKANT